MLIELLSLAVVVKAGTEASTSCSGLYFRIVSQGYDGRSGLVVEGRADNGTRRVYEIGKIVDVFLVVTGVEEETGQKTLGHVQDHREMGVVGVGFVQDVRLSLGYLSEGSVNGGVEDQLVLEEAQARGKKPSDGLLDDDALAVYDKVPGSPGKIVGRIEISGQEVVPEKTELEAVGKKREQLAAETQHAAGGIGLEGQAPKAARETIGEERIG